MTPYVLRTLGIVLSCTKCISICIHIYKTSLWLIKGLGKGGDSRLWLTSINLDPLGTHLDSLGTHLDPLGIAWNHLASLALTGTHLDSLGFICHLSTRIHLDSLGLTWTHAGSLGFVCIHLGSLGLTCTHLGGFTGALWIHLDWLGLIWTPLDSQALVLTLVGFNGFQMCVWLLFACIFRCCLLNPLKIWPHPDRNLLKPICFTIQ